MFNIMWPGIGNLMTCYYGKEGINAKVAGLGGAICLVWHLLDWCMWGTILIDSVVLSPFVPLFGVGFLVQPIFWLSFALLCMLKVATMGVSCIHLFWCQFCYTEMCKNDLAK